MLITISDLAYFFDDRTKVKNILSEIKPPLKDAERLKVHIQMKHTKQPFQCKHCNFTSMSNNAVKRHRAKVHAPNVKPT